MTDDLLPLLVVAGILGGVTYVVVRSLGRYGQIWGGRRSMRAGATDHGLGPLDDEIVDVAMNVVLARSHNGADIPTRVEVGLSPHDYGPARDAAERLQAVLTRRLACNSAPSSVRLILREISAVRSGAALVVGIGHDEPTQLLGSSTRPTSAELMSEDHHHRAWLTIASYRHVVVDRAQIGRTPQNDIQVISNHASANHATMKWSSGGWFLVDHSTNGTWLRGARLPSNSPVGLGKFAEIRLADIDCIFEEA